jgi:hypothetical protein
MPATRAFPSSSASVPSGDGLAARQWSHSLYGDSTLRSSAIRQVTIDAVERQLDIFADFAYDYSTGLGSSGRISLQ